jgi:hypothetical protein
MKSRWERSRAPVVNLPGENLLSADCAERSLFKNNHQSLKLLK